ncbi:hypothetical protein BKA70DRAFT_1235759 [Coprinopsis sp. MPI-PUGE-AT-0042]|nr:hypothetical protein BKA70DRAFT_1235759 [Coprinopsis sp. MPI-PUGE-AT-0042]
MPKTPTGNPTARKSQRVAGKNRPMGTDEVNEYSSSPIAWSANKQKSAPSSRLTVLNAPGSTRVQPGRKVMMEARRLRQSVALSNIPHIGSPMPRTRGVRESVKGSIQSMETCTNLLEALTTRFSTEVEKVTTSWVALREDLVKLEEENVQLEEEMKKIVGEAEDARARSSHFEGALRNAEVLAELLRGEVDEDAWLRVTGGYSQAK